MKKKATKNLFVKLQHKVESLFINRENNFVHKIIQTFLRSMQKFHDDEVIIRSTSIAYNVIVSFVPTLVVLLLIGARFVNIDEVFFVADDFILKNSIQLDIEPYKNIIQQILENTGAITGIGFLIMFFSATSVLRNLESVLNKIWHVRKNRPFIQKISGFIMVLLFGLSIFMTGVSLTQSLLNHFSPPNLTSIKVINKKIIVLGDKHQYLYKTKEKKWTSVNIINKIDFELQVKPIIINSVDNTILSKKQQDEIFTKLKRVDAASMANATFTDITHNNNTWWLLTNQGDILKSNNDGEDWHIQRYQKKSGPILSGLHFNHIRFFNSADGIIIGNDGLILLTNDAGKTWEPNYLANMTENFFDVEALNRNSYIIVGSNFTVLLGNLSERSLELDKKIIKFKGEKKGIDLVNIFVRNNSAWIIGDSGTFLLSSDQGKTWSQKNIGLGAYDLRDIFWINNKQGALISGKGKIRYTDDGGESWEKAESLKQIDLTALNYDPIEKKIIIVGESDHILMNQDDDLYNFNLVREPKTWRVFLHTSGNILLSFVLIWVVCFLIYKVMPYTLVSVKSASIGAVITSILWVIFLSLYKYFISSFAKGTFAIYGTLAAIPLTLLLVYISIIIVLFGAEISFFVQFPNQLKLSKNPINGGYKKRQMMHAFEILYLLYSNFEHGIGKTLEKDLKRICNNNDDEFFEIMKSFSQRGYVYELPEDSVWMPTVSAKQIFLRDVIEDLDLSDYTIMNYSEKNQFMKVIQQYFSAMENNKKEIFGQVTFSEILKICG